MFSIKKIRVKYKWKILRYLVKRKKISFHKCLIRMHHIQCLVHTGKYDLKKLSWFSYRKVRKMFINEFPDAYLHDPKDFK